MILIFVCSIPIVVFVAFMLNKNSYRNKAWIARQTGNNVDDVIWLEDKFKILNVDGTWVIKFYTMREKTPSIHGGFFTKFITPAYSRKAVSMGKDNWNSLDMNRHMKRGIYFYETTEGEFYPMSIVKENKDGKDVFNFTTVNQDNRNFIMRETQNINSLTRNKKDDKLLLWGFIVGIVAMVIVFGIIGYLENKTHEENVRATAELCGQYTVQIINALTNPNSTQPKFVNNIGTSLSLPKG